MNKFKEIFEANSLSGNKGDVVVVHTTLSYAGSAKIIKKKNIREYFSEENGFDGATQSIIVDMKSGDSKSVGDMSPNEVVVIKL